MSLWTPAFAGVTVGIVLSFSSSLLWARTDKEAVSRADIIPSQDQLTLAFPGIKGPVPYERFGLFEGVATSQYRYSINDHAGLAKAVGEGIYPNTTVLRDPAYQQLLKGRKIGRQPMALCGYADRCG